MTVMDRTDFDWLLWICEPFYVRQKIEKLLDESEENLIYFNPDSGEIYHGRD